MKRVWWVTLLGLLLESRCGAGRHGPAPGFKFREMRIVIDNLDEYPDYAFYLVAARWVGAEKEDFGPGQPDQAVADRCRVSALRPATRPGGRTNGCWSPLPRERVEHGGPVDWQVLVAGAPGVLHSNVVPLAQPSPVLVLWPADYEVRALPRRSRRRATEVNPRRGRARVRTASRRGSPV